MTGAAGSAGAGRYGPVARHIHWLVVMLAVIVISLGWAIAASPLNTPTRNGLLLVHRSFGLIILALMAFRALWRCRHAPPPLPPSVGRIDTALAQLTHLGLYLIFIVMPLFGYLNAAAAGHNVSFFGVFEIPQLLPTNERVSQWAIAVHLLGQYAVYLLVVLHVAGALYHAMIKRDGVLGRMLPPRGGGRPGA